MAAAFKNVELPEHSYVISSPIDSPPGQQLFFVNSDTAFSILSENAEGPTQITVTTDSQIGGVSFGETALMPGPDNICSLVTGTKKTAIYASDHGTHEREGLGLNFSRTKTMSQTVLVSIFFDPRTQPEFKIIKSDKAKTFASAPQC